VSVRLRPAQATIECGGEQHRLRWEDGELRALDHEDVEGERTLAALGGESYACLDVLEAWHRHAEDLRVLVLASRGPADPLKAPEPRGGRPAAVLRPRGARPAPLAANAHVAIASTRAARAGRSPAPAAFAGAWTAYGPGGRRPQAGPGGAGPLEELRMLLQLGSGLPDRLAAGVATAWARRRDESARPALQAALYGRVLAALRGWLAEPAADVELRLGDTPRLTRAGDALEAELPLTWLADVWAPGLAVVAGRFVLAADEDERGVTLTTVGPELGESQRLTLSSA
jgi:hypothetical protein